MRIRDTGQTTDIISGLDYKPYGEKMPVTSQLPGAPEPKPQRLGYISKEQDRESRLADHGVRKYDYDLGRFTSTDALWEKYPGWSPYQYSANNPINMLDWNGKDAVAVVNGDVITIKAVYEVSKYSTDEITKMNSNINEVLNNKNYTVSEGEFAGKSVKFDLKFVAKGDKEFFSMETNIGGVDIINTFDKKSDGTKENVTKEFQIDFTKKENGSVTGGTCGNNKWIIMNEKYDTDRNKIHEIFHTLFFNNDGAAWGIGSYKRKDLPSKEDINKMINNEQLKKVTQ